MEHRTLLQGVCQKASQASEKLSGLHQTCVQTCGKKVWQNMPMAITRRALHSSVMGFVRILQTLKRLYFFWRARFEPPKMVLILTFWTLL